METQIQCLSTQGWRCVKSIEKCVELTHKLWVPLFHTLLGQFCPILASVFSLQLFLASLGFLFSSLWNSRYTAWEVPDLLLEGTMLLLDVICCAVRETLSVAPVVMLEQFPLTWKRSWRVTSASLDQTFTVYGWSLVVSPMDCRWLQGVSGGGLILWVGGVWSYMLPLHWYTWVQGFILSCCIVNILFKVGQYMWRKDWNPHWLLWEHWMTVWMMGDNPVPCFISK